MNSVATLFSAGEVLLDPNLSDKNALFEAVGRLWEQNRGLSAAKVQDSLNAREFLGSTGLGQGVAIPHARIDGLSEAVAAFVRPRQAIPFGSSDGKPVSCCFVLLVPLQATQQHLQILADVAEMLSSAPFRERLATAKTREEAYRLFAAWNSSGNAS